VGGAFVCIYNFPTPLPQNQNLVLTRSVLAQIFAHQITNWNDSSITNIEENKDRGISSKIPGHPIIVIPFPDPDTAEIMVQALFTFDSQVVDSLSMYLTDLFYDTMDTVLSTPYSIGCLPYSSVNTSASIIGLINKAGTVLLTPDISYITSAMNDFLTAPMTSSTDLYLIDGSGSMSWPICAYDALLFQIDENSNCAQISSMANMVTWMYTQSTPSVYIQEAGIHNQWLSFSPYVFDSLQDMALPPTNIIQRDTNTLLGLQCNGYPILLIASTVTGEGATFPLLLYQSWADAYDTNSVQVTYLYTYTNEGVTALTSSPGIQVVVLL
jgi:ABC-type phosphate transport system substrate-binding protein